MAELEKLTAHDRMFKAFANLQASMEKALERAYKSVKDMESEKDTDKMDDMWIDNCSFFFLQ